MADTATGSSAAQGTDPQLLCAMCDKPAPDLCARCSCNRYCSKACQKTDRPTHKLLCKKLSDFSDATRPAPNMYRTVYFPVAGSGPQFRWMRFPDDSRGQHWDEFSTQDALTAMRPVTVTPAAANDPSSMYAREANVLSKRPFRSKIVLYNPRMQGVSGNRSVAKIDEAASEFAPGPLLFFSQHRDLDTTDFKHIVDEILEHFYRVMMEHNLFSVPGGVKGLLSNCNGDIILRGRPPLEDIWMPHGTTDKDMSFPLGDAVGIPIVINLLKPHPVWRNRENPRVEFPWLANAHLVHIFFRTHAALGGSAVMKRKDGKPLLMYHFLQLVHYGYSLIDSLRAELGYDIRSLTWAEKNQVESYFAEHASKEGFKTFYERGGGDGVEAVSGARSHVRAAGDPKAGLIDTFEVIRLLPGPYDDMAADYKEPDMHFYHKPRY